MARSVPIPRMATSSEASLREELEEIGRRAHETRVRLALGEATTGVTALIEIEHRCHDALEDTRDPRLETRGPCD